MADLMSNAGLIFAQSVAFAGTFSNGTVDVIDVIFAAFGGFTALALLSYAKNIVR